MKKISGLAFRAKSLIISGILLAILSMNCTKGSNSSTPPVTPPVTVTNEVDFWLTKSDETVKLQKQTGILAFATPVNQYANIDVDEGTTFQAIDGFGYTLTGGSAEVINSLDASKKQQLLQELFGSAESSINISYLRLSIGASDLNAAPFTYDDLPAGQTDINLANFSLAQDTINLVPLLKEILAINPNIK